MKKAFILMVLALIGNNIQSMEYGMGEHLNGQVKGFSEQDILAIEEGVVIEQFALRFKDKRFGLACHFYVQLESENSIEESHVKISQPSQIKILEKYPDLNKFLRLYESLADLHNDVSHTYYPDKHMMVISLKDPVVKNRLEAKLATLLLNHFTVEYYADENKEEVEQGIKDILDDRFIVVRFLEKLGKNCAIL